MTSILIVEDDITYGMMLKTWLGKKGFQVTSASSIARAQKHIESETVDLILSDLRLTGQAEDIDREVDNYRSVTAEQLHRVAQQTFRDENGIVLYYQKENL